jgi:hypothetical protein
VVHPLVRRLLVLALSLIAIPVVAYGLFLVTVLIVSAVSGPIRWN